MEEMQCSVIWTLIRQGFRIFFLERLAIRHFGFHVGFVWFLAKKIIKLYKTEQQGAGVHWMMIDGEEW
ncbi:hypothetical protein ACSS6W_000101 [Trichoderma asperelloides]